MYKLQRTTKAQTILVHNNNVLRKPSVEKFKNLQEVLKCIRKDFLHSSSCFIINVNEGDENLKNGAIYWYERTPENFPKRSFPGC